MKKGTKNEEVLLRKGIIHFVLLHSYLIFFIAVVFGVIFDVFIPSIIFQNIIFQNIGIVIIFLGTALIYWAQSSSGIKNKIHIENLTVKAFENGPYKYSPNPTHLGLFIMTLGLGFVINSLFTIIFVIVAYIFIKIIFVKKQEKILKSKYGQVYVDYLNKLSKLNKWL